MNRSVSLTLTAEDYVAANQLHLRNHWWSWRALVAFPIMFAVYLVWVVVAYIDGWSTIGLIALTVCFAAIMVALPLANYFLLVPISTRRTYRKHKALHRPHTYSWSETGLTITSTSGEWRPAWSDFLKWDENAEVFIIYQAPRLFNIMAKRALSPEQIVDIRQCAARIGE